MRYLTSQPRHLQNCGAESVAPCHPCAGSTGWRFHRLPLFQSAPLVLLLPGPCVEFSCGVPHPATERNSERATLGFRRSPVVKRLGSNANSRRRFFNDEPRATRDCWPYECLGCGCHSFALLSDAERTALYRRWLGVQRQSSAANRMKYSTNGREMAESSAGVAREYFYYFSDFFCGETIAIVAASTASRTESSASRA